MGGGLWNGDELVEVIEEHGGPGLEVLVARTQVRELVAADQAVEAARFYVSLFPDSRIDSITPIPADTPSGPEGSVPVVEFTLAGQPFMAISAGPLDPFNHAISFIVNCDDQAEIDRYWDKLLEGGKPMACGWLTDKFGVSWQIVPRVLPQLLNDPNPAKSQSVMKAMLQMTKLDIGKLKEAYERV